MTGERRPAGANILYPLEYEISWLATPCLRVRMSKNQTLIFAILASDNKLQQ